MVGVLRETCIYKEEMQVIDLNESRNVHIVMWVSRSLAQDTGVYPGGLGQHGKQPTQRYLLCFVNVLFAY